MAVAVGWAIGLERLTLLLQQIHAQPKADLDFYVVSRGDRAEPAALTLAHQLRQAHFKVDLDLSGSAFGKQFKWADRSGAVACLILGDAEADAGTVQVKWLGSGEQEAIAQSDLLAQAEAWRQRLAATRL